MPSGRHPNLEVAHGARTATIRSGAPLWSGRSILPLGERASGGAGKGETMKLTSLKQLGQGGFGIVDLVQDEKGVQFARKTFFEDPKYPPDIIANVRKRFIREAKLQSGIAHKNIVPVVGGALNHDPPFYLMPVASGSLADDLTKDETLGGRFLSAFNDIVAGLEELHEVAIYHRDLKPQNVLKFGQGNDSYYAISDFGFISQKDSQLSKLTSTGMAKGSDYYTAPEITSDLRNASAQSDIYSLGCILHDMVGLASRVPCAEIREDGQYGGILRNCTRQNPKNRFKSVSAVLDAVVSVGPSAAAPPTPAADEFVKELAGAGTLSEKFWVALVEFVEDNVEAADARAILIAITRDHIDELCKNYPTSAQSLGMCYAQWVRDSAFNFDACDGIANRLEVFINGCGLEAKVDCLMAMLELGTSHNRWYVERKFLRFCGPSLEQPAAKRLAIEFRTSSDEVCRSISHLEGSISVDRNALHPILVTTLGEICK
jgi:hypothetical protein